MRQYLVHQQGGTIGHASCATTGAETAPLTAGKVFFGLISGHRLVPQPSEISSRFKKEFEKLLYLGMMSPLDGRPDIATSDSLLDQPS
jgi:hypothetical protein